MKRVSAGFSEPLVKRAVGREVGELLAPKEGLCVALSGSGWRRNVTSRDNCVAKRSN